MERLLQNNKNCARYWNKVYDREITRGNFRINRMLLKKVREAISYDKVLDIGCGNGLFVNYCKQFKIKAKGIDYSNKMIKYCNNRYGNHFAVADINTMSLKDDYVECITMLEVLEHLDDPLDVIDKAMKWCKKQLIITVPNGKAIKSAEHVWAFEAEDFKSLGFEVSVFNRDSRLLCIYNKEIEIPPKG